MSRSKKMRIIRRPMPLGVLRHRRTVDSGLGGEVHLVVLDVGPGDVSDRRDIGCGDQPAGRTGASVSVGQLDASWGEKGVELGEIAAHGRHQLRGLCAEVRPLAFDSFEGTQLFERVRGDALMS